IFLIGILLLVAELARALAAPAEDGGSKLAALLPAAWAPYLMPGPAQPEAAKLLGWVGLAACAFGAIAAVFRPAGRWRAARRRWAFRGILFGVPLLLCGWLFAQEEVGSRIDWAALAAASVLSLAVLGLAWLCIDPNATSLHGFYRDRLADAFLGDARGINAPGATPTETPRLLGMSGLLPERTRGPFPILNATVNGAPSKDMARRGRRGEPFTITPLQAGNVTLDYCRTAELEKAAPDFDIAAAIALSGAALSPNAGSTSGSWFSVFLKGLLNVRTGRWLPAPEVAKNGTRPGSPSPEQFFLEVTGIRRTTEHDRWVFVSDGGHFENLGLLSLLHRRCDLILVVDSEADPQMRCNGLAVVTRLARLDLGAEIEIDVSPLRLDAQGYTRAHIVEGCVRYAATDPIRPSGVARLIYVKSSVNGDEAVDIAEYRSRHPAFPQETTADQFFSEEQFEAYRALGVHMGQAALPKLSGASKDVAADAAARQWPDPCRAA
ncbi:MAG: hypothetical protein ACJ8H8_27110, partial [Geminicoccaceae bacterium]